VAQGCLDDGQVARLVAGQCSPSEEAAFRAHLEGCVRCSLRVTQASGPALDPSSFASISLHKPPGDEDVHASIDAPQTLESGDEATEDTLPPEPARDVLSSLGRGSLLGRYFVLQRIGQGGMGVVFAAYDPELDRKVALKLLRAPRKGSTAGQQGQARLLREAQAMARISHPNVMPVYDVGTWEDRVFLAMEYVEGETLGRWQSAPRTVRETLETYVAAGQGLAAAHAAGLVHRDFKPENVLIGLDGRVRVTDFGLARQLDQENLPLAAPSPGGLSSPSAASALPPLSSAPHSAARLMEALDENLSKKGEASQRRHRDAITREGSVIGTPQYMSPEQHLGRLPDARSDQFSFCASLYYALYKKRPFEPSRLKALVNEQPAKESGANARASRPPSSQRLAKDSLKDVIQEQPREPKVPVWVRKAISRGLSLHPQDRFGSMAELLTELSRQPSTTTFRPWVRAAIAVGALGAAFFGYSEFNHFRITRSAEAEIKSVWDKDVRTRVENAFRATNKSYAPAAFSVVSPMLDDYARNWVASSVEVGLSTRRGEQTDQVLALRRVCLDRRLKDLKALTSVFSTADGRTVEQAVEAAHALPDLKRCSDTESLTTPVSPPTDEQSRSIIRRLAPMLSETKALFDAGKFKRGLEVAQGAVNEGRTLAYRPLQAEALFWLGSHQSKTGDVPAAEKTLTEAVWAAEAGRQDEMKLQALTRLIFVVGYQQSRVDDVDHWSRLGIATLERLGPGHDELEADLLSATAAVAILAGRNVLAQAPLERALRLADRSISKTHPKRANILSSLAIVLSRQGEHLRARGMFEEALTILEKARGPQHPSLAYTHSSLADSLTAIGDYDAATAHILKAFSILEGALGPDHPNVGDLHDKLAALISRQGRYQDALVHYQRALEIKERSLGQNSADLSYSLDGIGEAYLAMGRPQDALPFLERALALRKHDDFGLAETCFNLARALWESHQQKTRALELAAQAKAAYSRVGEKDEAARVAAWLVANQP